MPSYSKLLKLTATLAILALPLFSGRLFAIDPTDKDATITPRQENANSIAEQLAKGGEDKSPALSGPALLAILAVCSLGGYVALRKFKGNLSGALAQRSAGAIEICRTRSIGNRQYLAVVQVEGKRLLLGIGPGFISNLSELEAENFTIPYERKDVNESPINKRTTSESESKTQQLPEDNSLAFNNLISRINESLNRTDSSEEPPQPHPGK